MLLRITVITLIVQMMLWPFLEPHKVRSGLWCSNRPTADDDVGGCHKSIENIAHVVKLSSDWSVELNLCLYSLWPEAPFTNKLFTILKTWGNFGDCFLLFLDDSECCVINWSYPLFLVALPFRWIFWFSVEDDLAADNNIFGRQIFFLSEFVSFCCPDASFGF